MGGIITGFGMLFVGLSMMSGSMEDFAQLDAVKQFLATIGNPILLVVIGALFTAIMLWLPGKLSDGLRLCTNTLLILLFIGHIVYHDFPLGQLPIIGKYFRK